MPHAARAALGRLADDRDIMPGQMVAHVLRGIGRCGDADVIDVATSRHGRHRGGLSQSTISALPVQTGSIPIAG